MSTPVLTEECIDEDPGASCKIFVFVLKLEAELASQIRQFVGWRSRGKSNCVEHATQMARSSESAIISQTRNCGIESNRTNVDESLFLSVNTYQPGGGACRVEKSSLGCTNHYSETSEVPL
jgi:hypothetical protein